MQRMASAYVAKRIKDEIFAKPKPPTEPDSPGGEAAEVAQEDDLDRQIVHDEEGQPLGRALRVPGLAIYVVSTGYGTPAEELARCVDEPETRLLVETDGGRLTGLVYVRDPSRVPPRGEAIRAEDV